MMALPHVLCDVPGCEYRDRPILLPFPNSPEKTHNPLPWPDDHWRSSIVCPGCGKVSQRRAQNIRWAEHDPKILASHWSDRGWFCLDFDCDEAYCGRSVQLYLEMPAKSSSLDILKKINGGTVSGNMVCGHPLSIGARWSVFRVLGPIPTYSMI